MKYYIKQKVFSLKDKFSIKDVEGNDIYKIEGQFISLKNKLALTNMEDEVIYKSEKKLFKVFAEYNIFSKDDEPLINVKRKWGFKPKFLITFDNREFTVQGSLFAHSFQVMDESKIVASIQKKVISWGDSYEIDIIDESKVELFLFLVIIIDQVIHEQKKKSNNL